MKQKLFILMTLLLTVCSGAWAAEETILSFSSGTLTGATATYAGSGSLDTNKYKFGNSDTSASTNYVQLTLSSGTFQTGDKISITYYSNKSDKTVTPGLFFGTIADETFTSALSLQAEATSNTSSSPVTKNNLTVTETGNGSNVLRLTRYNGGTGLFITAISITRTVASGPIITTQPQSASYAVGDTPSALTITATASSGNLSYQWYSNTTGTATPDNDTAISEATSAELAAANISTAAAGTTYYYCVVADGAGAVTSSVAAITVAAASAPTINIAASATTVTLDTSVTLTATVTGVPTPTLQWYTCDDAEGANPVAIDGATELTYSPSTATVGTFYYLAKATNASGTATSNVITLTVNGTCAKPTLTIGSYDYEHSGYPITPSCETADATLTYKLGNGAATACTAGTPFYAVGGNLVITAAKEGWTSAESSSVTLNAAPSAVSPESLIPVSSSTDDYDKDKIHAYKSVNIASTYFAGINGGEGFKLRTGRATSITDVKGLELKVNSGYKVTKVAISKAKSNDSKKTISISKCYVDGEEITFTPKELPVSGTADADLLSFNVKGFEATSSIVFELGTEATQYRLSIEVTYEEQPVAVTPAYDKTTYVTTKALDFSDVSGLKAYVATAATAGKVTLSEVGAVPAGTPLMLIGTANTEYSVPVAASAEAPAKNMFQAGDGTTTFDGTTYDYILYNDGKFYQIGSGTVATTKAYLHCDSDPTTSGARGLSIVFEDETTGIDASLMNSERVNSEVYNFNGQRVAQPSKGLYIVNGKKVVVK